MLLLLLRLLPLLFLVILPPPLLIFLLRFFFLFFIVSCVIKEKDSGCLCMQTATTTATIHRTTSCNGESISSQQEVVARHKSRRAEREQEEELQETSVIRIRHYFRHHKIRRTESQELFLQLEAASSARKYAENEGNMPVSEDNAFPVACAGCGNMERFDLPEGDPDNCWVECVVCNEWWHAHCGRLSQEE